MRSKGSSKSGSWVVVLTALALTACSDDPVITLQPNSMAADQWDDPDFGVTVKGLELHRYLEVRDNELRAVDDLRIELGGTETKIAQVHADAIIIELLTPIQPPYPQDHDIRIYSRGHDYIGRSLFRVYSEADGDGDTDADGDADGDTDADGDADTDGDTDADGDADADADGDADGDTDADPDCDRNCGDGICCVAGGEDYETCPEDCPSCSLATCYPGTCRGETCVFDCRAELSCVNAIVCPPGIPCEVLCGDRSCRNTIDCSAASVCSIDCSGELACTSAITCGSGYCKVACGAGSCTNTIDCTMAQACAIECSADSCDNQILCSSEICEVFCDDRACLGLIDCSTTLDCHVRCPGEESCYGPIECIDTQCIECTGRDSCLNGYTCTHDESACL